MRVGRTLPPAAAPIGLRELAAGLEGMRAGQRALDGFQAELKAYFGAKHCFLVSSGKAALTLILGALRDLAPGRDEVVIPAFTCYSVPSSVLRAGLRIRLCDLAQDSLDMDVVQLSAAQSASGGAIPLAIVPTHLYGCASDVARIRQRVGDSSVAIVEDAAQAMGETREGRKLGTLGDVGFFSLGRGKAFSSVEGGVVLTDRDDIAQALRTRLEAVPEYGAQALLVLIAKAVALAVLGHPLLFWIPRALPFLKLGETLFERDFPVLKMSAFQAGLARNWRERLQAMREARSANSARWAKALQDLGARGAGPMPSPPTGAVRFPLRIADAGRRRALLARSAATGAGVAPAYPASLNRLAELKGEIPAQECPAAERWARELVTLPTHGYVTPDDEALIRRLLANALSAPGHHAAPRGADIADSKTQSGMKAS